MTFTCNRVVLQCGISHFSVGFTRAGEAIIAWSAEHVGTQHPGVCGHWRRVDRRHSAVGCCARGARILLDDILKPTNGSVAQDNNFCSQHVDCFHKR